MLPPPYLPLCCSICLPLRSLMTRDRAYLGALLAFTALAFAVICACYCRMYSAVRGGQDARAAMQRSDVTVSVSAIFDWFLSF